MTDVVSALAYSIAGQHGAPDPARLGPPYNDVARFLESQLARLPDYLRLPMKAATLAFDWAGLIHLGGLFHRQPPPLRARQVSAWRNSPLPPCREFIRFYEALALLALHSR